VHSEYCYLPGAEQRLQDWHLNLFPKLHKNKPSYLASASNFKPKEINPEWMNRSFYLMSCMDHGYDSISQTCQDVSHMAFKRYSQNLFGMAIFIMPHTNWTKSSMAISL
jgi:hypothetical protein